MSPKFRRQRFAVLVEGYWVTTPQRQHQRSDRISVDNPVAFAISQRSEKRAYALLAACRAARVSESDPAKGKVQRPMWLIPIVP
jgi:hypothetical protein